MLIGALALAMLAQAVPTQTLTRPERSLEAEFSLIRGVRELADGRILVADRMDDRVVVADLATGRVTQIGRRGRGPGEYVLPSGLLPLPGDSTLLFDEGNGRMQIISPDLRLVRTFTLRVPEVPTALWPRGVDTQGRYYAQVPMWAAESFRVRDSAPVLRIDPRTGRWERISHVLPARPPSSNFAPRPRIPFIPFSPQDSWTVASDGRVALLRSGDYHVEWLQPNGQLVRGRPVPFTRRPVTDADKMDYTRRFSAGSGIGGKGGDGTPPGGISAPTADMLEDRAIREMVEASEWATTHPPFLDVAPMVAPDGTLWVARSVPRNAPPEYDVFDATGTLVRRVQLPAGRRLVRVGARGLYAVSTDEDGIERVERYAR